MHILDACLLVHQCIIHEGRWTAHFGLVHAAGIICIDGIAEQVIACVVCDRTLYTNRMRLSHCHQRATPSACRQLSRGHGCGRYRFYRGGCLISTVRVQYFFTGFPHARFTVDGRRCDDATLARQFDGLCVRGVVAAHGHGTGVADGESGTIATLTTGKERRTARISNRLNAHARIGDS